MRLADVTAELELRCRTVIHLARALHISGQQLRAILEGRKPVPAGFLADVRDALNKWDAMRRGHLLRWRVES